MHRYSRQNAYQSNQSPENPQLILNVFGISLSQKVIYRHNVKLSLVDDERGKEYILTNFSVKGRGTRVSKLADNHTLVERLLQKFVEDNRTSRQNVELPIYAYDGSGLLFSVEPIEEAKLKISTEEASNIEELSVFLKDSVRFMKGSLDVEISIDGDKPSFEQTDVNEWVDERFTGYLGIATSMYAVKAGSYLPFGRGGLHVLTMNQEDSRVSWACTAKAVHKGTRIVGTDVPTPILEIDPQTIQFFRPITLDLLMQSMFGRAFDRSGNFPTDQQVLRKMSSVLRELRCQPYYADKDLWSTNSNIVSELDFEIIKTDDYKKKFPNIKFQHWPAVKFGNSVHRPKHFPLEYLRIMPYVSVNKRILDEFEMIPRAADPTDRWRVMTQHFAEFKFDNPILKAFGISVCNDPNYNMSILEGARVDAPQVNYANPVQVDEEKRDWRPRDSKFVICGRIDPLIVIVMVQNGDLAPTKQVYERYVNRCREKGIKIGETRTVIYNRNTGRSEYDFLTDVFSQTRNDYGANSESFVLVISDVINDLHDCIKFEEMISDTPTQHVMIKTVKKIYEDLIIKKRHVSQNLENIVLKTNVKSGGLNYSAEPSSHIASWVDVPTFVVGLDVAHPDHAAMRDGSPSTIGMSCNAGETPYTFIGDFAYTTPRKEAIDDYVLNRYISRNVREFAALRGFPKRIIIVRDGVSFGEEAEAKRESDQILDTIAAIAAEEGIRDYHPTALVLVVRKRHHTRFYRNLNNMPSNPLPDTAVGGLISEYGKRQIYVQAFRPIQGTAKIPGFDIIRDDVGLPNSEVQNIIVAMCSLHQIVNSPTSLPTPLFVAHEFAKRGTDMLRAYKMKNGQLSPEEDWRSLTMQLSYADCQRLSKRRIV